MGRLASYAIKSGGAVEYRVSVGGATSVPRQICWGPSWFGIESFFFDEADSFVGTPFCEAGLGVDFDLKVLRVFGGEMLQICAGLQHAFVDLLATTWPGWDVGWAHQGIHDVAAVVGIDNVEPHMEIAEPSPDWIEIAFATSRGLAISVIYDNRKVVNYRMEAGVCDIELILALGPKDLLARLHKRVAVAFPHELDVPCGAIIDVVEHCVVYWYSAAQPDHCSALSLMWPGWRVERQLEGYAAQLRSSNQLTSKLLLSQADIKRELGAEVSVGRPGRESELDQNLREAHSDGRIIEVSQLALNGLTDPFTPSRQQDLFNTWLCGL